MSAIKQPTLNYAFVAKVLAGLLARGRSLHYFKLGFIVGARIERASKNSN